LTWINDARWIGSIIVDHRRQNVRQEAMKNLSAVLQAFRRNLPDSSLTAQAIDRGALLEEISQVAALERVHQLATILFEAEQEAAKDTPDTEIDFETAINKQISQLRSDLPDTSKTAKAIDRGATWEEISAAAQEESLSVCLEKVERSGWL
jgi:vacuolar-type H+-ATPase catalytic subunit A/Vma1